MSADDGRTRMSLRERVLDARQRLLGHEVSALTDELRENNRLLRTALGTLMAHDIAGAAGSPEDAQFTAFSQYGEDGVIEYLVRACELSPRRFVEIGVETYAEANTRFLAEHRLWEGLIVDQNPRLAEDLRQTRLHWRAQVSARSSFVTRENARDLVAPFAAGGGIGLLSLDIDGVDYWILEQLTGFDAALIVVEYNALFGSRAAVTVPYEPAFDRRRPEFHNVYYGASLGAYDHLLGGLGYSLVACTTAGNNAFFVRTERLRDLAPAAVADAFRPRQFGEHRLLDGSLSTTFDARAQVRDIAGLPLVDVTDGHALTVGDLGDLGD